MAGFPTNLLGKEDDPQNYAMTVNDVRKLEIMYKCKVTTTDPPLKPTYTPCQNMWKKGNDCDELAKKGYCENTYVQWMNQNCKRSCMENINPDEQCNNWAVKGYCNDDSYVPTGYMRYRCAKACNFCWQI